MRSASRMWRSCSAGSGSWVSGGRLDADLAMVVEKLAGAVDGWDLALDSLRTRRFS